MIKDSINILAIRQSYRFNASFHLSMSEAFERKICKFEVRQLHSITLDIYTAGRSKRNYSDSVNGIPYLGNTDISSVNPKVGCKYVSKKYWKDKKGFLKEGMILTGRVGQNTVGAYTYSNKTLEGCVGSDNVIRIIPDDKIKSGFLFSYLASKYGFVFSRKHISGNAQPFITEDMLGTIPVPIFNSEKQFQIHNLISESAELHVDANRLLEAAEQMFLDQLSLDKIKDRIFSRSERTTGNIFLLKKSALSPLSFRARNYSPRKQEILKLLRNNKFDKLIEVLECPPSYGARFKRIEATNGNIELLAQGDIFDFKPKGRLISKKNIPNLENELVKKGTILIPAQGTLGENEIFARAKLVWGYLENKLVAGHAMRFIPNPNKISEGYLYIVLSSNLWFRLLRNSVYGTNLLGFIIPFLNDYPIPRFDKEIEQIIDQKVKLAYIKLTASIDKENQAIQLVEKEIDQWQQ